MQKKDNSSDSTLTVSELESEIKKATRFSPKIECFIMATTSAKDVIVEKRAREITETNKKMDYSLFMFLVGVTS